MSPSDDLPDSTMVEMGWVRKHFVPKANAEHRDMTTVELSEEFGHSPDWWRDRCRSGRVHGAYQGGGGRKWYAPRQQATLFLRDLKEHRRGKRASRQPWKGARAA